MVVRCGAYNDGMVYAQAEAQLRVGPFLLWLRCIVVTVAAVAIFSPVECLYGTCPGGGPSLDSVLFGACRIARQAPHDGQSIGHAPLIFDEEDPTGGKCALRPIQPRGQLRHVLSLCQDHMWTILDAVRERLVAYGSMDGVGRVVGTVGRAIRQMFWYSHMEHGGGPCWCHDQDIGRYNSKQGVYNESCLWAQHVPLVPAYRGHERMGHVSANATYLLLIRGALCHRVVGDWSVEGSGGTVNLLIQDERGTRAGTVAFAWAHEKVGAECAASDALHGIGLFGHPRAWGTDVQRQWGKVADAVPCVLLEITELELDNRVTLFGTIVEENILSEDGEGQCGDLLSEDGSSAVSGMEVFHWLWWMASDGMRTGRYTFVSGAEACNESEERVEVQHEASEVPEAAFSLPGVVAAQSESQRYAPTVTVTPAPGIFPAFGWAVSDSVPELEVEEFDAMLEAYRSKDESLYLFEAVRDLLTESWYRAVVWWFVFMVAASEAMRLSISPGCIRTMHVTSRMHSAFMVLVAIVWNMNDMHPYFWLETGGPGSQGLGRGLCVEPRRGEVSTFVESGGQWDQPGLLPSLFSRESPLRIFFMMLCGFWIPVNALYSFCVLTIVPTRSSLWLLLWSCVGWMSAIGAYVVLFLGDVLDATTASVIPSASGSRFAMAAVVLHSAYEQFAMLFFSLTACLVRLVGVTPWTRRFSSLCAFLGRTGYVIVWAVTVLGCLTQWRSGNGVFLLIAGFHSVAALIIFPLGRGESVVDVETPHGGKAASGTNKEKGTAESDGKRVVTSISPPCMFDGRFTVEEGYNASVLHKVRNLLMPCYMGTSLLSALKSLWKETAEECFVRSLIRSCDVSAIKYPPVPPIAPSCYCRGASRADWNWREQAFVRLICGHIVHYPCYVEAETVGLPRSCPSCGFFANDVLPKRYMLFSWNGLLSWLWIHSAHVWPLKWVVSRELKPDDIWTPFQRVRPDAGKRKAD